MVGDFFYVYNGIFELCLFGKGGRVGGILGVGGGEGVRGEVAAIKGVGRVTLPYYQQRSNARHIPYGTGNPVVLLRNNA
jgi:hypothetical protein